MARKARMSEPKRGHNEDQKRLLNPDRVAAYLDEFTALSRRYGIRIENIGSNERTICTISHDQAEGKYRLINADGAVGWSLEGYAHYNEHGEGE